MSSTAEELRTISDGVDGLIGGQQECKQVDDSSTSSWERVITRLLNWWLWPTSSIVHTVVASLYRRSMSR